MDSLDTYRKKRDFRITPEPAPAKKRGKSQGYSFCVQKHDATRLHYDFRLELDGVLRSWAVTRGPSFNPADKRLAVRTEDHPLDYGDFEGIIPAGEYGGGTVMLWDEGTWEPLGDPHEGIKKGSLKFHLHGARMNGGWALVRMRTDGKHENWLLIKEMDDEAIPGKPAEKFLERNASSVKTGRSMREIAKGDVVYGEAASKKSVKKTNKKSALKKKPAAAKSDIASLMKKYPEVQLATLVTDMPEGDDWIHEIKFDGYRMLCFVTKEDIRLISRNGKDWTDRFPKVVEGLQRLKITDGVFDGEAVILDEKGRSNFQSLQMALGDGGDTSQIEIYLFDLLYLNGKDISQQPLMTRKEALKKTLKSLPAKSPVHYSDHLDKSHAALSKACALGLEGLISKDKNAPYAPGRGKQWLKSKCIKRQEFIILGYTKARKGNRAIGALHIGYMDKGKLTYASKVGTGFDFAMAEKMEKMLAPLKTTKPATEVPRDTLREAIWVKPKYLCEVSFTEWTVTGGLRHPSFEGLRLDKKPKDVTKDIPLNVKKAVVAEKKERKSAKEVNSDGKVFGVTITHPEREIFESVHITKQQLAEYYAAVGPLMLKQMAGHPISLLRCPGGADKACFFQRNPDDHMKKNVKPFKLKHGGKMHEYLYVEDPKGLVFLVQMGVIEIHPWNSSVKKINNPVSMIFDLDPAEDVSFEAVKLAALDLRKRLKKLGLESFVKCTGGKGLHVTVPLSGKDKWEDVYAFSQEFAKDLALEVPEAYIATMSKEKRRGKIFIDYLRNNFTSSAIADYAVRARKGAAVAVPLEWRELKALPSGDHFKMNDVLRRIKRKKIVGDERYTLKQNLPKA